MNTGTQVGVLPMVFTSLDGAVSFEHEVRNAALARGFVAELVSFERKESLITTGLICPPRRRSN